MVRVKFRLTDKNKALTAVYAEISYGLYRLVEPGSGKGKNKDREYLQLKYTTPVIVPPKLWTVDKRTGEGRVEYGDDLASPEAMLEGTFAAIKTSAKKNQAELNAKLMEFKLNVQKAVNHLTGTDGRLPSRESVKAELDKVYRPNHASGINGDDGKFHGSTVVEYIDFMIRKRADINNATIKSYKLVIKDLADFEKKKKTTVTLFSADLNFYNSFVKYLMEKGLSTNTIGTRIKIIKTALKKVDEGGEIPVSGDYKKTAFKKIQEKSHHIYLNEYEIKKITNAKLDDRQGEIRDLFIIGCWSGLRISDLSRLKSENIQGGMLRIRTKKTGSDVVIPVTSELQRVLDKYPDKLPKIPSEQFYNRQIKSICALSGIREPVMVKDKDGNSKPVPKYELVTSHTARRSFATNLYRRGIPSTQLMYLTGHKTESSFRRYIEVDLEDNAKDVAKKLNK